MNTSFHKFAFFFLPVRSQVCSLTLCGLCPTQSRAHTHTDIFIQIHTHTVMCIQRQKSTYIHAYIHTCLFYIHVHKRTDIHIFYTHSHTLTHTHSHTLTHTHSHTLTHTHTLTLTRTHTHSLSHTHSHTLTHSHILTHTYSLTHTLRHALDVETYRITMFVVFVLCLIKLLTCGVIRSYNVFCKPV